MADRSGIEWTEATWNPTTGCDRTSPGCENCYALALARRLKAMGSPKYQSDGDPRTSGPGFALAVHSKALAVPSEWASPRMIFVNSMSDLFHEGVPFAFIEDVFNVIAETPRHTYQVLTKRSRRLAEIAEGLMWPPNLWMGVSIESSQYQFRSRDLVGVPSALRFLSLEPLLGAIPNLELAGIDWVIAGGESGPSARSMEVSWVRDIRDQCIDRGVPFFFKQWGGRTPKAGGRLLDGRIWNEMPGGGTTFRPGAPWQ